MMQRMLVSCEIGQFCIIDLFAANFKYQILYHTMTPFFCNLWSILGRKEWTFSGKEFIGEITVTCFKYLIAFWFADLQLGDQLIDFHRPLPTSLVLYHFWFILLVSALKKLSNMKPASHNNYKIFSLYFTLCVLNCCIHLKVIMTSLSRQTGQNVVNSHKGFTGCQNKLAAS